MSGSKHFGEKTPALDVVEGVDLIGKEAIVTGGNSGIGVETVRALAKAGARVILTSRDVPNGEIVADKIRKEFPKSVIEVEQLKLDSLANVRAFVDRFLAKKRPLHILINNAGIMACPLAYTEDGFESQFGVNHIGHFALTVGLLPALKAAKKARVVNVSSMAHIMSDIDFNDINFKNGRTYVPFISYGQSKSANSLMAVAFNKRYASEGITANSLMPGGILTNLQRNMSAQENDSFFKNEAGEYHAYIKTPEQGASTQVWAAVAPELEGKGGLYLENCAIAEVFTTDPNLIFAAMADKKGITTMPSGYLPRILDPELAEKLWIFSEKAVEKFFPKA